MAAIDDLNFNHLVGKEVGTAVLLKELARGGMAVIFIAYQKTLKRRIAVKILPKSIISRSMATLFHQEAESAAILSHPNIIPIYEIGETEDFLFFTMPLVKGLPLSRLLKRIQRNVLPSRRFLPVRETIRIVRGVLDALDYAHGNDIVHRDVKPANVMIEAHSKRPIIMDFGIVKIMRTPETNVPVIMGTPVYMAPEQIVGGRINARTDIYAVGVMLFEMLVSNLPFPQHTTKKELIKLKIALKDELFKQKPSELNPFINNEMDKIVLRATAYHPKERYESCREFIEHLKEYRDLLD